MDPVSFLGGMFGTTPIEIIAALSGLLNVVLIVRRSLWNYPFGFLMVTLYAKIFYDYRLYSDAGLQLYFFVIQIFGLIWWLNGRQDGLVQPRALPVRLYSVLGVAVVLGIAGLGGLMARYTDAALPWWDAAIAVLSITAQTLLARRYIENWYVWIAVDVLSIGVFTAKGLVPTAALYVIFLVLSVLGLLGWRKSIAQT
jgi:nicotinamide mononucleotide transporter